MSYKKHITDPAFTMIDYCYLTTLSRDTLDRFNNGEYDKLLSDIAKQFDEASNAI